MLSASRRRLREKTTTQQGVLVEAAVVPEVTMPVIAEETWRISLRNTPPWQPPIKSTVVLAPHLDDETLGAGGPVASQRRRGLPVLVVAITEGEAAYPASPGLGDIRRAEQHLALAELGVKSCDTVRLRLPDGAVTGCEEELVGLLRQLVGPNTLLVAPWCFDPHPDHEASGRAAQRVACRAGATLVSYLFWLGIAARWNHWPLFHFSDSTLTRNFRKPEQRPWLNTAPSSNMKPVHRYFPMFNRHS
jgi:LmbE family N-acetylglucosaminyl deacetylase